VSSAWRGKANMMTMEWHMAMAFEPSLIGRYRALPLLLFALALILAAAPSAYSAEAPGTHVVGSRKGNRRRGARWRNVEAQRRQDREADRGQGSRAAAWLAR
jgi:hypothetical protein